ERADALQLASTLNRYLARPLIDLNRGPQKKYPRIRIGRAESTDPDKYTQAVGRMAQLGFPISISEVRGRLGWKAPADEADTLKVASDTPAGENPVTAAQPAQAALQTQAGAGSAGTGVDSLDGLTDDMLGDWERVMTPLVAPIE